MLPVKKTLLALVLLCCSGFVFGAVSDLSVTKYRLIEKPGSTDPTINTPTR